MSHQDKKGQCERDFDIQGNGPGWMCRLCNGNRNHESKHDNRGIVCRMRRKEDSGGTDVSHIRAHKKE